MVPAVDEVSPKVQVLCLSGILIPQNLSYALRKAIV